MASMDVRAATALLGLAVLTFGVAGKWDSDVALIVLGVLLLFSVLWGPTATFVLAWSSRPNRERQR